MSANRPGVASDCIAVAKWLGSPPDEGRAALIRRQVSSYARRAESRLCLLCDKARPPIKQSITILNIRLFVGADLSANRPGVASDCIAVAKWLGSPPDEGRAALIRRQVSSYARRAESRLCLLCDKARPPIKQSITILNIRLFVGADLSANRPGVASDCIAVAKWLGSPPDEGRAALIRRQVSSYARRAESRLCLLCDKARPSIKQSQNGWIHHRMKVVRVERAPVGCATVLLNNRHLCRPFRQTRLRFVVSCARFGSYDSA